MCSSDLVPLFNLSHGKSTTPPLAKIDTPAGTTSVRLEYRATGHGGANDTTSGECIGPAEEFCARTHHLYADNAELQPGLAPWREDCQTLCTRTMGPRPTGTGMFTYCKENPCGAISSVEAPRANWCPGSLTPPLTWDPAALKTPGPHDFTYRIDNVADGGSWRLSATFFAYAD